MYKLQKKSDHHLQLTSNEIKEDYYFDEIRKEM